MAVWQILTIYELLLNQGLSLRPFGLELEKDHQILEGSLEMANKVEINTPAPEFELTDFNGRTVHLSDYRGEKNVVLVFNRGFT